MKEPCSALINDCIKDELRCRDNSFYVRFTDADIDALSLYAFDMGYRLEPEPDQQDQEHPLKFKIISKSDPRKFGWVSKVMELSDGQWQERLLYGFYRHEKFFNKYPISFNVHSRQMRGMIGRKAEKVPRQRLYFRTLFGIMDLEPQECLLDFIFSWLSSCKIQHV